MARRNIRHNRSFGPIIHHEEDGSFRASCDWCIFRIGSVCTFEKPSRPLPRPPQPTPEWCQMLDSMMRDAMAMVNRTA